MIQKILDMIPVKQSDMWKNLGINSRDGSRLISLMLERKLIKRTYFHRTFLIERLDGEEYAEIQKALDMQKQKERFVDRIGHEFDSFLRKREFDSVMSYKKYYFQRWLSFKIKMKMKSLCQDMNYLKQRQESIVQDLQ